MSAWMSWRSGSMLFEQIWPAIQSNIADRERRGPLEQAVLAALATFPLARADLRAQLRVRNERLGETLTRLAHVGAVCRLGDRWGIPYSAGYDLPQPVASSRRGTTIPVTRRA
jgi:hypothetical protein